MLKGKTILLGVTGGIAAYKAAAFASALVKLGSAVEVVMTETEKSDIHMQKKNKNKKPKINV